VLGFKVLKVIETFGESTETVSTTIPETNVFKMLENKIKDLSILIIDSKPF
jgi:hypothetical protein